MNYLLYLESDPDFNNEHFILFETNANEEITPSFIQFYFSSDYQILGIFPTCDFVNEKNVERITFTEEEVIHKLERKQRKDKTIADYNQKRSEHLQAESEKIAILNKEREDTRSKMNTSLYIHVRPENVTKEMIQELKEKGFHRNKSSNGFARFRNDNHQTIREEFEKQLAEVEEKVNLAGKEYWKKRSTYEEQNPIENFDDVLTYYSSQRN